MNRDAADIVHTFSATGDRTRLTILTRLMQGELPLLALASPLEMSLTAVSKHLSVLQKKRVSLSCKKEDEHGIVVFAWSDSRKRQTRCTTASGFGRKISISSPCI